MGRPFREEVEYLPQSIGWALEQKVELLERAVNGVSDRNLLGIGSGGSYSAATYIALLHEIRFGRLSRPITPLEYRASSHNPLGTAAALISAEGKNTDILAAARSMLRCDHPGFALTLTSANPLAEYCRTTGAATVVSFDMPWRKDGFLATNSLVASMVLLARAYAPDHQTLHRELRKLDEAWVASRRLAMLESLNGALIACGSPLIVLFGTIGRAAATDVESKMSEAALVTCQIADYRQFAHGRHLQVIDPKPTPFIVAFTSATDRSLADATLELLPQHVSILKIELPNDPLLAEIIGVIDAILLVDIIAEARGIDPGQPVVPQFGRELHALDIAQLRSEEMHETPIAIKRKFAFRLFSSDQDAAWESAKAEFCNKLATTRFRGLVCDFDGTFCDTDRRFDGLDERLIPEVVRLLSADVIIAFATGRGDSLFKDLRAKLPQSLWSRVIIGYFSGSHICPLNEQPVFPPPDSRFDNLIDWLRCTGLLQQLGAQPKQDCGQLGLRSRNHVARIRALSAIRYWIRTCEMSGWRAYSSGHSIDVLTEGVGKERVVASVMKIAGVASDGEILRLGDSGDFDGNDFELLKAGIGLSVGSVSPIPETCWNLLPEDRRGTAGTLHYLSSLIVESGTARFSPEFVDAAKGMPFKACPGSERRV